MEEYPVGIPTNVWNAIRYAVITLAMVPLAEKFWDLAHSRRTGHRIMHGRTARLRQSKLAHWGLHQEVDEKSRLSKISAIVVCVLHITGALLLEYASGSTESFVLQDAMLSQTLRDDGDLRANGAYFIDASYAVGPGYGSNDCIDGEQRNLLDFGLRVKRKPVFAIVSSRRIPEPNVSTDLIMYYTLQNSGWVFQVYERGRSRWYAYRRDQRYRSAPTRYLGFENETVICGRIQRHYFSCSKHDVVEFRNQFSTILALAAVPGISWTNLYWWTHSTELSLNLSRAYVSVLGEGGVSEDKAETKWMRSGMHPKQMPDRKGLFRGKIELNITDLHNGCKHRHAVSLSDPDKLSGLKVLHVSFPSAVRAFFPDQEDHKLILHTYANYVSVGTRVQLKNESCFSAGNHRLCIRSLASAKHELAFYIFHRYGRERAPRRMHYLKRLSVSMQGILRKTDAFNIAVQSFVEMTRVHPFSTIFRVSDLQKVVVELIENGRISSGRVRVLGTQVKGKSVLRPSGIATVNILGLVGLVVLILLLAVPVPMVFYYRKGIRVDVESSFRRSAMEINGMDSFHKELDRVPSIGLRDEGDGKLSHTFKM